MMEVSVAEISRDEDGTFDGRSQSKHHRIDHLAVKMIGSEASTSEESTMPSKGLSFIILSI